jgi:hypothetical protein
MNYTIPPLIEGWIMMLHNQHCPDHIKENYCMMLEQVAIAATKEVAKFKDSKKVLDKPSRKIKNKRSN